MFNALSVSLFGASPDGVQRASASLERQGFVHASTHRWHGGAVAAWGFPPQYATPNFEVQSTKGTVYCVGPIWYRGRFGNDALRTLLDESNECTDPDERALRGNFALFLQTPHTCRLWNDLSGFVRIYRSADAAFYSTSWLATCAYTDQVELDAAAAVEYVLLGASHSDATVGKGISTLPLAYGYDLTRRTARARRRVWLDSPPTAPGNFDAVAQCITGHLQTVFREIAAAFPARARMALSGGFDSRLILAGLLHAGVQPELFVYGSSGAEDVQVATAAARAIGLPLEVIDKAELDRDRKPAGLELLVANALFFDGLPNDGIRDPGSDRETRLAQTADGKLALNGGGGEIFRNYFHLPDKRLSALDVVRTFYRGFDRHALRSSHMLVEYERRMATAVLRSIDEKPDDWRRPLQRDRIELAYPWFRCHHWMAVNNSTAIRHGHFVTPLVDPIATALAWRLPLAWKHAGRLESRLITNLHHGVADAMSAHGFRFSRGPTVKARFTAWCDLKRPVSLRPLVGALGRRIRRAGVDRRFLAQCRELLPGPWQVDPHMDLNRVPDDNAVSRALAIEVWWRKLR